MCVYCAGKQKRKNWYQIPLLWRHMPLANQLRAFLRHSNALIKAACKTFAVQSTHAFWGLYLETGKEHFTVSSHRVESKILTSWCVCFFFLFGSFK